jgi:hypothetical protein
MASPPEIRVEVVYALPERSFVHALTLPVGSCVRDALQQSGINAAAGIIAERLPVGIFSEPATLDTPLNDGDRVELYRPLINDPMLARRGRVKTAKR